MNAHQGSLHSVRHDQVDVLSQFCHEILASLPRSDQRRWGEIYVRGLVSLSGRKSIRRMAETLVGARAEQALQQFVNQSTWAWAPVRQELARYAGSLFRSHAWAIGELVFPKNGSSSVAVDRQFAPSAGRLLNCQVGFAAFAAGPDGAAPINWRLLLPPKWDTDTRLRNRAHVPTEERRLDRWQMVLDMIDQMVGEWDLSPVPVVLDARHGVQLDPLLAGLDERGLHYLVQVPQETASGLSAGGELPAGGIRVPAPRGPVPRTTRMNWWAVNNGRQQMSRFAAEPVAAGRGGPGAGTPWRRARKLVTEWVAGEPYSAGAWLTNVTAPLPELIELARTSGTVSRESTRLYDDVGLSHFEGRSFRGWHHHVTLTSLAHTFLLGRRLADRDVELRLRPYG